MSKLEWKTFADLMKESDEHAASRWRSGRRWGCWKLRLSNLTLEKVTHPWYEIDLEDCTSSAQTLDWICQVANKNWATDLVIASLVRALNDLLRPQERLCSWGTERGPLDVKKACAEDKARRPASA